MSKYIFTEGQLVHWNDPDDGLCSNNFRVLVGSGEDDPDCMVTLIALDKSYTMEVLACELTPDPWNDDNIQFPRLLAELNAVISDHHMEQVGEAMDLSVGEVYEILDRADQVWEDIKSKI